MTKPTASKICRLLILKGTFTSTHLYLLSVQLPKECRYPSWWPKHRSPQVNLLSLLEVKWNVPLHVSGKTVYQQVVLVAVIRQFKENRSLKKLSKFWGNKLSSSANYRNLALVEKMVLPVSIIWVVQFGALSCLVLWGPRVATPWWATLAGH